METDDKCVICGEKAVGWIPIDMVPLCAKCCDDLFWSRHVLTSDESKMAHCVNSENEIYENHEENS